MRRYLDQVKAFYRQNRLLIIFGLGFLLLMQICSRGGRVDRPSQIEAYHEQNESLQGDEQLKPLSEIYREEAEQRNNNPEMTSFFILMALVLLVFVATKRGWLQKLAPSIVWVTVKVKRHKQTKSRIAIINVLNQSKESLTFSPPTIAFGSISKKARRFRIKSGNGQDVFPLTLVPGTAHNITIDLDAFRSKAGGLKGYNWVKIEVNAGLKNYSSFWKFIF